MDSQLSTLRSPLRRRGGFALLITITLLAFLVILLVGLGVYTRVETSIAGNTQRQTQARQNALVALNLAVAQLQKYAGPDARVTASAEAIPGRNAQKRRYTGVWDTTAGPGGAPIAWLASGLETGTSPSVTQAIPAANQVALTGPATDGSTFLATGNPGPNNVVAALQNLTAPGVPGQTGSVTIGKYAWWVADNGLKADVARTDVTSRLNYAPFVDGAGAANAEMRTRLLQQTGQGAGPFSATTSAVIFDPRDTANLTLAANTIAPQQVAFLRTPTGPALGLAQLRTRYHSWTVGNFGVLARTNAAAGQPTLRNDLSLNPAPLGMAFTAWADYPTYMESPEANPLTASLAQPASALRRRYKMTPAVADANGSEFSVAPVLSYVALAFSLRNNSNAASTLTNLECSVRCVVGLWNPYTGALVPETSGLQLFVTGLPSIQVHDSRGSDIRVSLQDKLGDPGLPGAPFKLLLPWTTSGQDDDHDSWLPGRVYNWSLASSNSVPADGAPMDFAERNLANTGSGLIFNVGAPLTLSKSSSTSSPDYVARHVHVDDSVTLTFELRRVSDGVTLATFQSPVFNGSFRTVETEVDNKFLDFAYVFRLGDPLVDGVAWLSAPAADLRKSQPPSSIYVLPGSAIDPSLVVVNTNGSLGTNLPGGVGNASLLLDRYPGTPSSPAGTSPDEDVPVFELPRSPLLSVAQLQHLALPALQPFWIGQSAASAGPVEWNNSLFDQHFFSGLGSGSNWTDITRPLPNTLARVLRRKPSGAAVAVTDFDSTGMSAKHVLQGGAFNLNSTEPDAWAAVLRSVRFPTGRGFTYLDADAQRGTSSDTATATQTGEAAFPRFSQSGQETFKTTPDYLHFEVGSTDGLVVHTEYYRKGVRILDAATVTALAQNISAAVRTRIATSGPFLSLEEFLNPANGAGTPSLLEQAIADLALNLDPNDPAGGNLPFSSSFLTQADIMTALAPVLFVRSDTFTVRAYGEATNPLTGATEGKAWCEAIVQRVPEPFAPASPGQPTDDEYQNPPGEFGRRFKIISVRWLTRSDL